MAEIQVFLVPSGSAVSAVMVPSGSLELFLFVLLVITTHSALGNQDTKSTADPDNNEGKPKIYYYLETLNLRNWCVCTQLNPANMDQLMAKQLL